MSNLFCILDLALQRKHTLAHALLDAFEEENRSGGVPELYRTDIVLLLLVARVEPFRIRVCYIPVGRLLNLVGLCVYVCDDY